MMPEKPLQTYLGVTPRADLVELEQQRLAIYMHVGKYMGTWAHTDFTLRLAAVTRANPHGGGALQTFVK